MRSRIKTELSDYFKNEILFPGIVKEYKIGFNEMILLNKAYAIMLVKEKLIDEVNGKLILQGLKKVQNGLTLKDLDGRYEELYFNVEQALIKEVGVKAGGKLHAGRSRNDIYATLWRMEVRKSVWVISQRIIALQEALLKKSAENIETVLTGYTHMQPAQPVTLGFYYIAAFNVLQRDFERVKNAYARTNLSPYGAAALAGTGFPVNRRTLSDLLGFDGILSNALDCVGSKDYLLEVESALAIMMVNISRMAQDHYLWCTDEFGLLDIGGEIAVCSSIMPQKKNPVSLELARAKAAHIMGALVSSLSSLKNTPFSLCMDLFESHSQYWDAHEEVLHSLGLLTETIKHSNLKKSIAFEKAKNNFSTVTALADYLVFKFNISFSEAHDIVGGMVAEVLDEGLTIEAMNSSLIKKVSKEILGKGLDLSQDEINDVLEPHKNVQSKKSIGGPGKDSVEKMIGEANDCLEAEKLWLKEAIAHVESAYGKIQMEENRILAFNPQRQ
ncbi:argininosuccinate lyase [Pelotomaculum propionicicum]|uniref:Argininosuccinate lyase n=1 Tax=Pelotomaculum propionicicum TaxID=258475 RepID=A0A4Y7RR89_9FIRM|nr:argininosuccinate lyase [Pelotomaculum propionicicum]NLI11922.1 argininosuccinate lyase [Peptococcaceae bacterium]TEB11361.1 Argininosuccinate lyase [Pelotomaculum propionicicum]